MTCTLTHLKDGWKMPEPPTCCGQRMIRKVELLGLARPGRLTRNVWHQTADCEVCDRSIHERMEYPFVPGYRPTADDFKALGFEVQE